MKDKLTAVKAHILRNRAKYAIAGTATVLVGVYVRKIVPEWNEFLKEQGVYDAYYEMAE